MKIVKENNIYKLPVETINLDYSPNPVLINADGVVTSATGGNGWVIYPQTGYSEVYLMLNATANPSYPRWQTGNPNFYAYFKTFSAPTIETLFLLVLSMIVLKSADSIRFLYRHFLRVLHGCRCGWRYHPRR